MGGQTALNCALDLERHGVLEKFGVEMIGANADTIDKAEDRSRFDKAMKDIGLACPRSGIAHSMEEAYGVLEQVGFPCIIRPSFTMGGTGGGIAYNREEFEEICARGLDLSPTNELLIDESLIGWKEYEMEVVRDKKDNCIIVCSIENFDPMGVHTGDSITVAPAQTLTDKEYQIMRNASLAVLREIGVETGGSNVQFGICPNTGRMVVIEMNPRVSRSSALASKATGFPIAKIAAKLAVGYTLDELQNDITGGRTGVVPGHRLRGDQDPALRLREIPESRCPPDHPDEVGRRSHGHRPDLPGVGAESLARPGSRRHRLRSEARPERPGGRQHPQARADRAQRRACLVRRRRLPRRQERRGSVRADPHRRMVPGADRGPGQGRGEGQDPRPVLHRSRADVQAQAQGLLRRAPGQAARRHREEPAQPSPQAEGTAGLQARRYLRRRVRHRHRLHVFDL